MQENIVPVFEVVDLTPAKSRKKTAGWTPYKCPVCGTEHLYINHETQCFSCKTCGEGGGQLDFWSFVKNLPKGDYTAIAKDLHRAIDSQELTPVAKMRKERKEDAKPELLVSSVKNADKVYREFLLRLSLSQDHGKNLSNRGFSKKSIEEIGFKTVPSAKSGNKIIRGMEKDGFSFKGVPGFVFKDGKAFLPEKLPSGYFVPVQSASGHLWGMQIRTDEGSVRYKSFSSSFADGGGKWLAKYHSRVTENKPCLLITEGPIKAEIISRALNVPVIGLLGSGNIKGIPKVIEKMKLQRSIPIHILFDMDLIENAEVKKSVKKFAANIASAGIPNPVTKWAFGNKRVWYGWKRLYEEEGIKGFDDYLFYLWKQDMLPMFKAVHASYFG